MLPPRATHTGGRRYDAGWPEQYRRLARGEGYHRAELSKPMWPAGAVYLATLLCIDACLVVVGAAFVCRQRALHARDPARRSPLTRWWVGGGGSRLRLIACAAAWAWR